MGWEKDFDGTAEDFAAWVHLAEATAAHERLAAAIKAVPAAPPPDDWGTNR